MRKKIKKARARKNKDNEIREKYTIRNVQPLFNPNVKNKKSISCKI